MGYSPATQAAIAEIEAIGSRDIDLIRAATFRLKQRTNRRKIVNGFMPAGCYGALMRWLSEDSPYVGGFMTTAEARNWLRKEIVRILKMRRLRGADYFGFRDNAHRLPGLRDRLIVAIYFDRFGARLWVREAA